MAHLTPDNRLPHFAWSAKEGSPLRRCPAWGLGICTPPTDDLWLRLCCDDLWEVVVDVHAVVVAVVASVNAHYVRCVIVDLRD
jgi:hypothetical protein